MEIWQEIITLIILSDKCKEIEENNRLGKTRDLFKKIRHTKGTFHAKMGLIKDSNGMDITEEKTLSCRPRGPKESDTTEVT